MKMRFGDELRNILIKENLTQKEFASKVGCFPCDICEYINNHTTPILTTAERMLNAIGYELVIKEKEK